MAGVFIFMGACALSYPAIQVGRKVAQHLRPGRAKDRRDWAESGWGLDNGIYRDFSKIDEQDKIMATIKNDRVKFDMPGRWSHYVYGKRNPTIPKDTQVQVLCKKDRHLYSYWGSKKMTVAWRTEEGFCLTCFADPTVLSGFCLTCCPAPSCSTIEDCEDRGHEWKDGLRIGNVKVCNLDFADPLDESRIRAHPLPPTRKESLPTTSHPVLERLSSLSAASSGEQDDESSSSDDDDDQSVSSGSSSEGSQPENAVLVV